MSISINSIARNTIIFIWLTFIAFGQQGIPAEIKTLIDNNMLDSKTIKDKIPFDVLNESQESQKVGDFDDLNVIIEQRDSEKAINQDIFLDESKLNTEFEKSKELIDEKFKEDENVKNKENNGQDSPASSKNSNDLHFGYNFFMGGNQVFENTMNDAIDPDYLIGPGDQIILMLWGQTEFNRKFTVSREGYLFIDDIGQVFVNGLTLDKLQKKLFNLLKKVHSSLDPPIGNPSTFFDLSLGSSVMKPKKIFVVGEVEKPGAYLSLIHI